MYNIDIYIYICVFPFVFLNFTSTFASSAAITIATIFSFFLHLAQQHLFIYLAFFFFL